MVDVPMTAAVMGPPSTPLRLADRAAFHDDDDLPLSTVTAVLTDRG
jgi:hypothetical protein